MKKSLHHLLIWSLLLCLLLSGCSGAALPEDTTAPAQLSTAPVTEPVLTEPDGFITLPVEDGTYATEPDGSRVTIPQWNPDETEQEDDRPRETEYPEQPEQPTQPEQPPSVPNSDGFKIYFIDVGQADAALIICDGKTMLIDGGNSDDSSLMYTYLKNRGVSHLDYLIATHAHEDHVGGLAGALNYASVGKAYCPTTSYSTSAFGNFLKGVQKHGKSITIPSVGTQFALGSATCSVLAVNTTSDTNNTSIVVRIVYGSTSFLFTGDAERDVEQSMLNRGVNLRSTVLKVGHHGSYTSTSYQFLRSVMPQYAVISCGKGNSYGHPHTEVLSRLYDADVTLFRTDLQGDITCTSNGSSVSFSVSRNWNADVFNGLGSNNTQPDTQPDAQPDTQPDAQPTDPPETQAPSEDTSLYDYILNVNSLKFHYPECEWAQKISNRNRREYTGSRDDLLDQGYTPCGSCSP